MSEHKIPTFKQYVQKKHREAASRHEVTIAEARMELPSNIYRREWADEVIAAFNAGAEIPKRLWSSFDKGLQWRIRRSPRSLKGDDPAKRHA